MPKPNVKANIMNMRRFALAVAASPTLPTSRPTHIALIDPLSDSRTLDARVGNANATRVLTIGPLIRLRRPAICLFCPAFSVRTALFRRQRREAERFTKLRLEFDH